MQGNRWLPLPEFGVWPCKDRVCELFLNVAPYFPGLTPLSSNPQTFLFHSSFSIHQQRTSTTTYHSPLWKSSSFYTSHQFADGNHPSRKRIINLRGRGFLTKRKPILCHNTTLESLSPARSDKSLHHNHNTISHPTSTLPRIGHSLPRRYLVALLQPPFHRQHQPTTVQSELQKLFMYQYDKIPVHRHSDPPIPLQLFRNPRKPCSPNLSPDG